MHSSWVNYLDLVCVSEESGRALTAIRGEIATWDLKSWERILTYHEHPHHVHALAIVEALNVGLSAGLEDRGLCIWSLEDGTNVCRFISDGGWWAAAASRDGGCIVASHDEGLMVFDVVDGEVR